MKLTSIIIAGLTSVAVIAAATGCTGTIDKTINASDNITSKSVDLSGYDEIEASAGMHVVYTYGDNEKIVIKAPDNIIDLISVKKDKHTLSISTKDNSSINFGNNNRPIIFITSPSVNEFLAVAASTIDIIGTPTAGKIELQAAANGAINVQNIDVTSISAEAASNGSISISNINSKSAEIEASSNATIEIASITAPNVEFEASSNATISISSVDTNKANVESSSNATIRFNSFKATNIDIVTAAGGGANIDNVTCDLLNATSSSNGTITISGSATTADLDANSNGSINIKNLKYSNISRSTGSNGTIKQ